MKNLTDFISENKTTSIEGLIYEANFHAEDQAIEDLEPKMKDVAKFKLLVKKWDKLGEEIPPGDDDHYAGTNFEQLEKCYDNDDTNIKEKKKVREASNNFHGLYDLKKSDPKAYVKAAIKAYGGYLDAWYSWAKKYATHGKGRDKWISTNFIVQAFLGLGSWIINYGLKEEIQNQLLGRLIKKFDKDMGKLNGVEGVSTFLKMYDEKRVSMKQALETETATLKSIEELKEERTKHKYTIIGGFVEGQGDIAFIDNSKFESFDEILDLDLFTKDTCKYFRWTKYSTDSMLRYVLDCKGKIPGCFLCSGYYTFNNKNKDDVIPMFGYCDELPKKIYKYSGYDKKFFYRGKPHEEKYGYRFFDSLWMVPKED